MNNTAKQTLKPHKLSLAAEIVRSVCELDESADPHHCDTICVTVQDLEAVIDSHIEARALTAAEAQEVKPRVKPLKWESDMDKLWDANGLGVLYRVLQRHDGTGLLRINASHNHQTEWATSDVAKSEAQADYEARILSALEVSP